MKKYGEKELKKKNADYTALMIFSLICSPAIPGAVLQLKLEWQLFISPTRAGFGFRQNKEANVNAWI